MRFISAMMTRMTLRLLRHLHAAQLLDGQRVGQVHVHPGQVIHAVGVGDELDRRDVLADLLGAAVQVAQVRRDLGDDLAVGAQHQPQHAVRAGVLRPHVDEHLVGADVELDDGLVLFAFRRCDGGHDNLSRIVHLPVVPARSCWMIASRGGAAARAKMGQARSRSARHCGRRRGVVGFRDTARADCGEAAGRSSRLRR